MNRVTKFILPIKVNNYENGMDKCDATAKIYKVVNMDFTQTNSLSDALFGMKIITSPFVGEKCTKQVKRTWKERLFTLPWRPFQKLKTITYYKPDGTFIRDTTRNILYCHPADLEDLRRAIKHV